MNQYFKFLFIFLAALGLCCCPWAFSSCAEWGLRSSFSAWASHCGGFSYCGAGPLGRGFSDCAAQAYLPRGMWNLPGPGVSPPHWQADS